MYYCYKLFVDIGSECTIDSNCATTNTLCLIEFEECTIGGCQCGRDFYLKDGQCLSSNLRKRILHSNHSL